MCSTVYCILSAIWHFLDGFSSIRAAYASRGRRGRIEECLWIYVYKIGISIDLSVRLYLAGTDGEGKERERERKEARPDSYYLDQTRPDQLSTIALKPESIPAFRSRSITAGRISLILQPQFPPPLPRSGLFLEIVALGSAILLQLFVATDVLFLVGHLGATGQVGQAARLAAHDRPPASVGAVVQGAAAAGEEVFVDLLDVGDVGVGLLLQEHVVEELEAFLQALERESRQRFHAGELRDHLEGVALVHQEGLALGRVAHLGCVLRHERVEEGVESLVVAPFGAQDAAQSLRLLPAGAIVGREIWIRQVASGRSRDVSPILERKMVLTASLCWA